MTAFGCIWYLLYSSCIILFLRPQKTLDAIRERMSVKARKLLCHPWFHVIQMSKWQVMKARQFGNRRLDTWLPNWCSIEHNFSLPRWFRNVSKSAHHCSGGAPASHAAATSLAGCCYTCYTASPHGDMGWKWLKWFKHVSATAIQDASTPALAEVRPKFSLHVVQYMLWMLRCPATSCQAASSSGKQDEVRFLLCIQGCRYLLVCSTIVGFVWK